LRRNCGLVDITIFVPGSGVWNPFSADKDTAGSRIDPVEGVTDGEEGVRVLAKG
jgi:hypothetical protein